MKLVNFNAPENLIDELNEFSKKNQIPKSALIRMLIFVFLKKVEESRIHWQQMVHDYNILKEYE